MASHALGLTAHGVLPQMAGLAEKTSMNNTRDTERLIASLQAALATSQHGSQAAVALEAAIAQAAQMDRVRAPHP